MTQKQLDENLIGYLLGSLDEASLAQVEDHIHSDSDVCCRLEQLRLALEPLEADMEEIAPPKDLTVRTIARVAEYCCANLTPAPETFTRSTPQRSRWRRADLIVAATLLLMTLGIGLPALLRLRGMMQSHDNPGGLVQCQENMRKVGFALLSYQNVHNKFPSVAVEKPRDVAGMVVPILANSGVLPEPADLCCPGSGPDVPLTMTLDQARALPPKEFDLQAPNFFPGYAYSLGYRDDEGKYYGPMVPDGQLACDFPILADNPPADGGMGNSTNHGGHGQNVLFADGHVRFVNLRTIGLNNDDIYRNKANLVAAGLDACDPVLGSSAAKP